MTTRSELFLTAVDILQSGRSLDVDGEHGSGRTHVLRRVGDYFTTLGWRTIWVSGLPAFVEAPLVALTVAGVTELKDGRTPAIAAAVRALEDQVTPGRTLIVVDDWDHLDHYSGGVIRTVQARAGVPVLSSRLIHRPRHAPVLPTGSFTTTYSMRLPAMAYGELEAALEAIVGFRIEPGTLSRIFAKSGGNIGLATAVVDAARRAGHLTVDGGVGRATGSLWSPALRLLTDVVLAPLSAEAVEALEILALLGPADLSTASRAVGIARIGELEERAFLDVVDTGGSRIVTIHPPLLVEHFRHDALPGRRAELLARLDDLLAAGSAQGGETSTTARDSAAFVRLVHEQTRRRTLQAREAWHANPSLRTATLLLSALEVDGGHDPDEIEALVEAAYGLTGTEREEAEWTVARLALRAVRAHEPVEAVAELRKLAQRAPREAGLLLGRAAELEASFIAVPDTDPLEAVDTTGLSARAHAAVLRARGFWSIARGRSAEADRHLDALRRLDAGHDALADALSVLAHLVGGRMPLATRIANDGLAEAQRRFDAPHIRIYAYLAALAATLDRRIEDAEHILNESSFLGLTAPFPPLSFVGLKTLAAEMAARRGQRVLMEQLLADLDAAGLSDGPFLGQNSGLAYTRMAFFDDGGADAAAAAVQSGDALWERGALLSAAHAYLEALLYLPAPDLWERVQPRVTSVDAPIIARGAAFMPALVARDPEELLRRVTIAESEGRARDAAAASVVALRALEGVEPSDAIRGLEAARSRLDSAVADAPASSPILLTPREREVAELVAAGLPNSVIAEALVLSVRTVESHVNRLLRKAGLHRRQDVKGFLLDNA